MKIVIIGQGGHSKVIRDIVFDDKEYELIGFLDDKYSKVSVSNSKYYGPISFAGQMIDWSTEIKFVIAIGNNQTRKQIAEKLNFPIEYYTTLIHKTAIVSPNAKIGKGTVVMANAVINSDTEIGNHAIINTSSIVEHDNCIGDYVHICPRATLTGTVVIGEGTQICAGATIIPNRKVGQWSTIGAGATVIHDIPSFCTAIGVPAKVKIKTGL